jgi:hypothetical protein
VKRLGTFVTALIVKDPCTVAVQSLLSNSKERKENRIAVYFIYKVSTNGDSQDRWGRDGGLSISDVSWT